MFKIHISVALVSEHKGKPVLCCNAGGFFFFFLAGFWQEERILRALLVINLYLQLGALSRRIPIAPAEDASKSVAKDTPVKSFPGKVFNYGFVKHLIYR